MCTLEIILVIALVLICWMFFRLFQKHLILRHLFIHSSDWCAGKIEEVARIATDQITSMAIENAAERGQPLSESEALGDVNWDILETKKEWQAQADALQGRLRRNGIGPLDKHDLDILIWSPWIARIKP